VKPPIDQRRVTGAINNIPHPGAVPGSMHTNVGRKVILEPVRTFIKSQRLEDLPWGTLHPELLLVSFNEGPCLRLEVEVREGSGKTLSNKSRDGHWIEMIRVGKEERT
jgi:hypothetical protein